MSTIILPHRWTRQPPFAASVSDYVNFAVNFASINDAAKKSVLTQVGTVATSFKNIGVCKDFSETNYYSVANKGLGTTSNFAFVHHFRQNSTITNGGSIFALPSTSSNNNKVDIYTLSTGVIRADIYNSTGSATTVDSGTITVGGTYCAVLSLRNGTLQWYLNGSKSGSAATFSGIRNGESGTFKIGSGTGANCNHSVALTAFCNGNADPAALSANPWQIFTQTARRFYSGFAPANTYTLTAESGSFALSGTAATPKFNRAVTAASGSFALTGTTATPKFNRAVTAASGSFALAGTAASLVYGVTYQLAADSGSFALTGTAAVLSRPNRVLALDSGSIVLSGTAATFTYAQGSRTMTASGGTFALTGAASYATSLKPYDIDYLLAYMQANLAIPTASDIATAVWAKALP